MQTIIADAIEVFRIGFWAAFWTLFGSCMIALVFAWGELLVRRSLGTARYAYSGPGSRTGTILMLLGIAALACAWTAIAMLGGLPQADTIGEQVTKAVAGTDPAHIALLVGSVISVLVFSIGAIFYLYSEQADPSQAPLGSPSTKPVNAA